MWHPILGWGLMSISMRLFFQIPFFLSSEGVNSYQVFLGLRKSHEDIFTHRTPWEMIVDAWVVGLVVFQCFLLGRDETKLCVSVKNESREAGFTNGREVVKGMESRREKTMSMIRDKFKQQYQHCLVVSQGRRELEETESWKNYMLIPRWRESLGLEPVAVGEEERKRRRKKHAGLWNLSKHIADNVRVRPPLGVVCRPPLVAAKRGLLLV